MVFTAQAVKNRAAELGFNLVGIAPAAPSPRLDAYFQWIGASMHGDMGYMARVDRQSRRRDLSMILPGVRSILIVGLDYHALSIPADVLGDPSRGRIAAYAWGHDYHDLMTPRLKALADWLCDECDQQVAYRVYVDTGALLERSHAQQAGLGFIGKNTMLINARRGSYFFLGEILTDIEFDSYDPAHRETMCGSCSRCQSACPTNAFPEPYVLDARRCISYLTIEHKGWIERELRPLMGNWIFGCDVCQDVCPFSRFVVPTQEPAFIPADMDRAVPPLLDLLRLDDAAFHVKFADSPLIRVGRDKLVRNACIAAGNWGDPAAIAPLADLLRDPNPLVRGHATWALGRMQGEPGQVKELLNHQITIDSNNQVQDEIRFALEWSK